MPKKLTLIDYLNSFNYICIEDAGENYRIKMHSKISKKEGIEYFKLDGTPVDTSTYWVTIPKIAPQIFY